MHAETHPGDADGQHDRRGHADRDLAPAGRYGGQEHQQQRTVRNDRTQGVPAREAVARRGGHRHVDDRAEPADQRLQGGIEQQRADAGDDQVDRESRSPPDQQHDHRDGDQRNHEPAAAQPGHRLQRRDDPGMRGYQRVQAVVGLRVEPLQRSPVEVDEQEQHAEADTEQDHDDQAQDAAFGEVPDRGPSAFPDPAVVPGGYRRGILLGGHLGLAFSVRE
jgi:hypothetical protein